MPATLFISVGALYGASGVVLGALGAHGIRSALEPGGVDWWQTAVLYQLVHGLGLVALGCLIRSQLASVWLSVSGGCFVVGVPLFCGSLYALALGAAGGVAQLAPLGGAAFVLGWIGMLAGALRGR